MIETYARVSRDDDESPRVGDVDRAIVERELCALAANRRWAVDIDERLG
jgi:hypothetical protein